MAGKRMETVVGHPLFIRKPIVAQYVVRKNGAGALRDLPDPQCAKRNAAIFPFDISVEPGARLKMQAPAPVFTVGRFVTVGTEIAGT